MQITDENSASGSGKSHRIVIGVDEAGYGPNIGPMLVAATAWRVPNNLDESGFMAALRDHFHTAAWSQDCVHVPLGDSKQLYSPTAGLRTLEAGLLAMLSHIRPMWLTASLRIC